MLTRDRELYERLDLARSAAIPPVPALQPAHPQLSPRIGPLYSHFLSGDACQRVYWEGSHWRSMCALLDR